MVPLVVLALSLAAAHGAGLRGGAGGNTCDATGASTDAGAGVVLSTRPLIIYYDNFISDADIDAILAKGGPMLKPSRTDAGVCGRSPACAAWTSRAAC